MEIETRGRRGELDHEPILPLKKVPSGMKKIYYSSNPDNKHNEKNQNNALESCKRIAFSTGFSLFLGV